MWLASRDQFSAVYFFCGTDELQAPSREGASGAARRRRLRRSALLRMPNDCVAARRVPARSFPHDAV